MSSWCAGRRFALRIHRRARSSIPRTTFAALLLRPTTFGQGSATTVLNVLTDEKGVEWLIEVICELPLGKGIANSLEQQIKKVSIMLTKGKTFAAVRKLEAFIHHVKALPAKHISQEDADLITILAERSRGTIAAPEVPAVSSPKPGKQRHRKRSDARNVETF